MNNINNLNNGKPADSVVLECREVHKDYKDVDTQVKVLMGVNLSVQRGEQIAIMGRSGSGKTTLLQMLGGLDAPSSGEIWIDGHNLHRLSERRLEQMRNRSLGFIYQMHHLLPEFSAIENVAMPLLIGKVEPKLATKKAVELLEAVGLKERLNHRPAELSGGERQRVAIARALVNQPRCVLADEPTGNLDDKNAEHVLEVMQDLNRSYKTSLIIVTHDPALAEKMDRTLVLHGGQLS
jgi:lipoprotein-releasing system ATP-binding protein